MNEASVRVDDRVKKLMNERCFTRSVSGFVVLFLVRQRRSTRNTFLFNAECFTCNICQVNLLAALFEKVLASCSDVKLAILLVNPRA